ncbi:MAG: 2-oxoacid:acceptor oxidoreductase subunit alpha [Victivallaceae bacterium]
MDINLRIAGEAGQGLVAVGNLLVGAAAAAGLEVFSGKSYLSRIRGGLNWCDLRFADHPVFGLKERPELLLALNSTALDLLREHTAPGAVILLDGKQDRPQTLTVDFTGIAKQNGGADIMGNTVAAGTIWGMLGYPLEILENELRQEFAGHDQIIAQNLACAAAGYQKGLTLTPRTNPPQPVREPGTVMTGAAMIGLAAATSGVKFVTAYPMTPGTATLNYLAAAADRYGIVVEQAEDEIAAVNMLCGATYAGVPAMTTTSGGGFALMAEGLALAGMMELPIFILVAQRPGPATGMPTRTAQEDLKFAINAGHGEFLRIVYAPGTHQQCGELTRTALVTAHRFQVPAIMLTDQYLQDAETNSAMPDAEYRPVNRALTGDAPAAYVRYADSPDGVSPRAIPGGGVAVVSDSDEHDEAGHLTEDFAARIRQQQKRLRKNAGLLNCFIMPEIFGDGDAEVALLCWGSTYGACREYVETVNRNGGNKVAMIHFSQLWPLPGDRLKPLLERPRRLIAVEGNVTGQLRSLLREAGISREISGVNRYDGLPITAEFLFSEVKL